MYKAMLDIFEILIYCGKIRLWAKKPKIWAQIEDFWHIEHKI